MACGPARKSGETQVTLAVLPAESDEFPKTAQALTDSLRKAIIGGVDRTEVSKVSLEVVQLSIECVEPTVECYEAVGKSLSANRLLFAEVSGTKRRVEVTVTLFDVDAKAPKKTQRVFSSQAAATAGAADVVAEATR
jgi:hypothetical protein